MYITCIYRKGFPRIHVQVCKVCLNKKCKERKKLPKIRMAKRLRKVYPKIRTPKNEATFMVMDIPQDLDLGLSQE